MNYTSDTVAKFKPLYGKNKTLAGSYEKMELCMKVQFCIKILKKVIVSFYP